MKKVFVFCCFLLATQFIQAQAPQGINYQAVVRDGSGNVIASSPVGMQIQIHQTSATGPVVYSETFVPTTSAIGLVNLVIGQGTVVSGNFSSINWATGPYFCEVGLDPTGGSTYTNMGTQQLMSVPYALYAENSGTAGPTGPIGPTGPQGISIDSAYVSNDSLFVDLSSGITINTGYVTGATGANGLNGINGTNGINGISIDTAYMNSDSLYIELSSGTLINIGYITGPQGIQGDPGPQGIQGDPGPQGIQGVPGLLPNGSAAGNTPYWNGTSWVINSSNIYNNGNFVGIGTTSPSQALHIKRDGNTQTSIIIENTNPGNNSGERLSFNDENGAVAGIAMFDITSVFGSTMNIFNNRPTGTIRMGTAGTSNLYIANNGFVGIGNNFTSPSGKLHITGAEWDNSPVIIASTVAGNVGPSLRFNGSNHQYDIIAATGTGASTGSDCFAVWDNTASAYRLVINSNGTVGIGPTVPQTGVKLDVLENVLTYAGYFQNNTSGGYGLYSDADVTPGSGYGLRSVGGYMGAYLDGNAPAFSSSIYGAYAYAHGTGGSGTRYGVYGYATGGTTNYGGYFNGNVNVTGVLSKGSGTFRIDHPQDPLNKYLVHSFVESPDMMNVYNGNIVTDHTGEAVVELPSYFEAENINFKYQLTVIGTFSQAIVWKEITNNQFTIKTDQPNVKVSWQVTGVRNDRFAKEHPVIPEEEKTGEEKGKYLHPELYGLDPEQGINPPPTNVAADPGKRK